MCSISSIKQKKANKYAAFYYLCRKREKKMGQKEPIELA
ncbi:AraC family transcriptional regulator, partial [Bacteroides xylanisolvens]